MSLPTSSASILYSIRYTLFPFPGSTSRRVNSESKIKLGKWRLTEAVARRTLYLVRHHARYLDRRGVVRKATTVRNAFSPLKFADITDLPPCNGTLLYDAQVKSLDRLVGSRFYALRFSSITFEILRTLFPHSTLLAVVDKILYYFFRSSSRLIYKIVYCCTTFRFFVPTCSPRSFILERTSEESQVADESTGRRIALFVSWFPIAWRQSHRKTQLCQLSNVAVTIPRREREQ